MRDEASASAMHNQPAYKMSIGNSVGILEFILFPMRDGNFRKFTSWNTSTQFQQAWTRSDIQTAS